MVLFTSGSLLTWRKSPGAFLASPQVFACCLLLTTISLHFLQALHYDRICLLCRKNWIDGEKTWLPWGNLNICPCLYQLELPCHSQVELLSISSLKVWGNVQKSCHDVAYLLVWVENAMKDRQYGISFVWVNPNQVPCHAPLPKDKHLGILPQGKVEETPCGQISQLEVCQLLAAGPQVIYPIGLNGHDEPVITILPEVLDSSISLIASEHICLGLISLHPQWRNQTKRHHLSVRSPPSW